MTPPTAETINEVDFCGKMATAATACFVKIAERCPFVEARIEGRGSSRSKLARKDLRFYGVGNKVLLTGEVKLPGGTSAFDAALVKDAHERPKRRTSSSSSRGTSIRSSSGTAVSGTGRSWSGESRSGRCASTWPRPRKSPGPRRWPTSRRGSCRT